MYERGKFIQEQVERIQLSIPSSCISLELEKREDKQRVRIYRANKIQHSLKHCDILDEPIQLEGKMKPLENHAASKSHLHLHSKQHWDFLLPPATVI